MLCHPKEHDCLCHFGGPTHRRLPVMSPLTLLCPSCRIAWVSRRAPLRTSLDGLFSNRTRLSLWRTKCIGKMSLRLCCNAFLILKRPTGCSEATGRCGNLCANDTREPGPGLRRSQNRTGGVGTREPMGVCHSSCTKVRPLDDR